MSHLQIRSRNRFIPIAALTLLVPLSACASQQDSIAPPDRARAAGIVEQRERDLVRALVRRDRAGVSSVLANDFTCSVTGPNAFSLNRVAARFTACAGMGHDLSARASQMETIQRLEDRGPRLAEITSMTSREENGAIVVVSTQVYQHWMPYDTTYERRSRLTDTWMQRGGEWQLVRRISEPLPAADARNHS